MPLARLLLPLQPKMLWMLILKAALIHPRPCQKALQSVAARSAEYGVIMEELWTALDHAGKNWRQIYKVGSVCFRRHCGIWGGGMSTSGT